MKFPPRTPLRLYTEGTYQGHPSKTSAFISELVRGQIEIGGIPVTIFRFLGTPEQRKDALGIDKKTGQPEETQSVGTFMGLQDPILMENRDRLYEMDDLPILRGVYQVSAFELEYARWGAMLSNDTLTIEFHVYSVERELGRRLIEGDVLELPHLKDISLDGRVQRKLYEVTRVVFSPSGYDANYGRHILGIIARPLKHQQEFLQILDNRDEYGKTLAEQNSQLDMLSQITATNQQLAKDQVKTTGFDRSLMWFNPKTPGRVPDLFSESLDPPDGSEPVGEGNSFPTNVPEGSWFVRTDMAPKRLYRLVNQHWRVYRIDHKREWGDYNWTVNAREFMSDGSTSDKNRDYDLVTIQDAITPREAQSDPTHQGDRRNRQKT